MGSCPSIRGGEKRVNIYHDGHCRCKTKYGRSSDNTKIKTNGNHCSLCPDKRFSDIEDDSVCREHQSCEKGFGRVSSNGKFLKDKDHKCAKCKADEYSSSNTHDVCYEVPSNEHVVVLYDQKGVQCEDGYIMDSETGSKCIQDQLCTGEEVLNTNNEVH